MHFYCDYAVPNPSTLSCPGPQPAASRLLHDDMKDGSLLLVLVLHSLT
jgi:hypothetical protein